MVTTLDERIIDTPRERRQVQETPDASERLEEHTAVACLVEEIEERVDLKRAREEVERLEREAYLALQKKKEAEQAKRAEARARRRSRRLYD